MIKKSLCNFTLAAMGVILTASNISFGIQKSVVKYVCPMDADIVSESPGACPRCGMTLRKAGGNDASAPSGGDDRLTARPGQSAALRLDIPDVPVEDQNGRRLNFYTDLVKNKTVAINFIFTTCTTICPPLTATFRKVQELLGDRRDIELISVSVDPATDVPERLNAFAAKFNAGRGWTFVTGAKSDMDRLLKSLGAYIADKNDHTPMVLVINDSAGCWTRTFGLASAATLAKVIRETADKPASPSCRMRK
ncbi:MAG: SCO family protein [Acidobacteriota bacterium]